MHHPIPYAAIEQHGIVGDRRTAALVANDGTLDWLCLPDYDGPTIFGALLDYARGGYWRVGPADRLLGRVDRDLGWAAHGIHWETDAGALQLTDVMAWPVTGHSASNPRQAVLRRLRCTRGRVGCEMLAEPKRDFVPLKIESSERHMVRYALEPQPIQLWSDGELHVRELAAEREFTLGAGDETWFVLSWGDGEPWSIERARTVFDETHRHWLEWLATISCPGSREKSVRRAALLIHMLSYAPSGAVVAAPTTSLPERIGGDWNCDYRLAWVRDASLSLTALAWLGNTGDCKHYLEWLCTLSSSTSAPLQPVYGIRGELKPAEQKRQDLNGYRESKPVLIGNHAYQQHQLDAFGYLAECMHVYLEHGGKWEPEFWELLERSVDHVAANWQTAGNGIWELPKSQHYVSSRIMSWVALDRAMQVAQRLGKQAAYERWGPIRKQVHADTMTHGWNESAGSFKQRYEGDNLDAAALLVCVMDFLPPEHPRVRSTIDRIASCLAVDSFVYRFDPLETPGFGNLPLGEFEGAFLPCTFWLATAYMKTGRHEQGAAVLNSVESIAPALGLFSEGVDPRSRIALGNTPLLFSHVEYVRAATEMQRVETKGGAQ